MERRITLKEHFTKYDGELDIYDYECEGYIISIGSIFGTTEMNIKGYPTHYAPQLTYFKDYAFVNWKENISLDGDEWKDFVKEVTKFHEILEYFKNNFDNLSKGIIPNQD